MLGDADVDGDVDFSPLTVLPEVFTGGRDADSDGLPVDAELAAGGKVAMVTGSDWAEAGLVLLGPADFWAAASEVPDAAA